MFVYVIYVFTYLCINLCIHVFVYLEYYSNNNTCSTTNTNNRSNNNSIMCWYYENNNINENEHN